jgi:hypothetical protein
MIGSIFLSLAQLVPLTASATAMEMSLRVVRTHKNEARRGKVGGYREYLSAEDLEYASDALMKLDRRFGYSS